MIKILEHRALYILRAAKDFFRWTNPGKADGYNVESLTALHSRIKRKGLSADLIAMVRSELDRAADHAIALRIIGPRSVGSEAEALMTMIDRWAIDSTTVDTTTEIGK